MRKGDYSSFHNSFIAVLPLFLPPFIRLPKNDTSFYEKQAVVLRKTSRRFVESRKWMRRHREEVKKKVGGDGIFMGEDGE